MTSPQRSKIHDVLDAIDRVIVTSSATRSEGPTIPIRTKIVHDVPELAELGAPAARTPIVSLPTFPGSEAPSPIAIRSTIHVRDLLALDDFRFVRGAYRAILAREPEPDECARNVDALRSGKSGKAALLRDLADSDEAKGFGIELQGLDDAIAHERRRANTIGRIRGSRPVLRFFDALSHLSRTDARVERLVGELPLNLAGIQRIVEAQFGALSDTVRGLGRSVADLERSLEAMRGAVDSLSRESESRRAETDERLRDLERDLVRLAAIQTKQRRSLVEQERRLGVMLDRGPTSAAPLETPAASVAADSELAAIRAALYVNFEDRFRGSREDVRGRLRAYEDVLRAIASRRGDEAKAIDLGCGRGEWLEVLRDHRISGRGVDLGASMVEECVRRGLDATSGDAVAHLRGLPSDSVDLVTAFHVVEHIPTESLVQLLDEAMRVLRPYGVVILETPNPENLVVGAHTFHIDPTHTNPIPPSTLQFLVEYRGFSDVRIRRLHPASHVPATDDARLRPIVDLINGPQDYAVVASKS